MKKKKTFFYGSCGFDFWQDEGPQIYKTVVEIFKYL